MIHTSDAYMQNARCFRRTFVKRVRSRIEGLTHGSRRGRRYSASCAEAIEGDARCADGGFYDRRAAFTW